jgi:hypothetical protein
MKKDFVSQGILAAKCSVRIVFITDVCRVKRMTYRLKSDHGSSVVHPCSWREVLRVT